jgi:hypothetical protein
LCGEETISVFSIDKPENVYCQKCYWGDKWSAEDYGQDLSQDGFFDQTEKLRTKVPYQAVVNSKSEGSEFCNFSVHNKNCYLGFSIGKSEDCMYGEAIESSKVCLDCSSIAECENCIGCVDCVSCHSCRFVQKCAYSSNCYISYDLKGCSNCLMCWNLKHKNYHILNKPVSKEKFEKTLKELALNKRSRLEVELKKFQEKIAKSAIHKFVTQMNAENSTGCYLINCSNCQNCFDILGAKDCKFIYDSPINITNCYDGSYLYLNTSFCYEVCSSSENSNTFFSIASWNSNNIYYCQYCDSCSNCFGCVGLRHKQYCILNKQYSKDEYEKLVGQIIKKMIEDGEWGEFFPISMSPFGYNETVAMDYFPLEKEVALRLDLRWQDKDYGLRYDGPFYKPKDDIEEYVEGENERARLLDGVLKCETSKKPFKIMPQELAYYLENKIPVPTKHYDARYKERFALRHQRRLHHRKCMNKGCENEFETTYAPDRPEIVYCESCYQKSVI